MCCIVAHGASVTVQQGLPVVTAGKSVLADTGQLYITDGTLLQQALHLDVIIIELVLMENGELNIVSLCSIDQILNHFRSLAQRLLTQDVKAVSQQILGDRVVQVGVGCVGNEVQFILVSKQFGVVAQGLAAKNLPGSSGTVGISFHYILDVADIVVFSTQKSAMDVTAGTAKTNDCNV